MAKTHSYISKNKAIHELSQAQDMEALSQEQAQIRQWLKKVRFKKSLFGGVREVDVWKKIAELNSLYEAALAAERTRFDVLLTERTAFANEVLEDSEEYITLEPEQDEEAYE